VPLVTVIDRSVGWKFLIGLGMQPMRLFDESGLTGSKV
jgi:hypothetical protein